MRVASLLVTLFWATLANAQVPIDTKLGLVRVTGDLFEKRLFVGDHEVALDEGLFGVEIVEQLGDTLLVRTLSGGNACPAEFFWLETGEGAAPRRSASFGTCADLYDIEIGQHAVTVTMSAFDNTGGRVAFDYDGRALRERRLGAKSSGRPPAQGGAVWAGRHPAELLNAPEWRARFAAMMDDAAYAEAQRILMVAAPMERSGDWIAGTGCQAHACDATAGALAVSADGARLLVALRDRGRGPLLFGDAGGVLPEAVLRVMRNPWE